MRQLFDDFQRIGPSLPIRAIASFELLRRPELQERLEELNIPLDLLIVDEAHHMRNSEAATYRLGATLVNSADAVVFLTATPLHLGNRDLYTLLNLLAPEDFDNPLLFEDQVKPNQFINRAGHYLAAGDVPQARATLAKVETTLLRERFLQNPYYHEVLNALATPAETLSTEKRVAIQRELLDLNTLSPILSRTRKREVAHAAVRAAYTIRVEHSPPERAFYDAVLRQTRAELRALHPGTLGFGSVMKERQAASCLAAMRATLDDADRHPGSAELGVERWQFELPFEDTPERLHPTEALRDLAGRMGDADAKFDRFVVALRGAFEESPESKVLLFSYFRRTLDYLKRRLTALGFAVKVIHGGVPVLERRRIIDRFRTDPTLRILLSSEVGAEGLDFQFCDVLVNYDLPWNPMQVEQRIGRLDRFGQAHERIRIYNFCIDGTIETRIFQRLYERIGLFEQSIGDLEAILGQEITELSRQALQGTQTPDEEMALADQAAERIFRRRREEEELERRKDELLGQGHIFDQLVEQTITAGHVVSPEEVRGLVVTFIEERFQRTRLIEDHEEPCATLDIDPALASHLRTIIEQKMLRNRVSPMLRAALGGQHRIPITFDSELARQRPNLDFVNVWHPLTVAAIDHWSAEHRGGIPASAIQVEGPACEAGDG